VKVLGDTRLRGIVCRKLADKWSPQHIPAAMRKTLTWDQGREMLVRGGCRLRL
jgi:IS30 family transposase